MIRSICLISALALACPAQAASAQLAEAGANSLHVWTEGLFAASRGSETTRLVGLEFSAGERLQVEGKAALQQTLDPDATDGGYLAWAARVAPAQLRTFGPRTTFAFGGGGQFDAVSGSYTQSLSGGLEWKPQQPMPLLAGIQIETELVLDGADGSVALKSTPEWILRSRVTKAAEPMRAQLKARLEYTGATNAAPSVFAGLVFEIKPE